MSRKRHLSRQLEDREREPARLQAGLEARERARQDAWTRREAERRRREDEQWRREDEQWRRDAQVHAQAERREAEYTRREAEHTRREAEYARHGTRRTAEMWTSIHDHGIECEDYLHTEIVLIEECGPRGCLVYEAEVLAEAW